MYTMKFRSGSPEKPFKSANNEFFELRIAQQRHHDQKHLRNADMDLGADGNVQDLQMHRKCIKAEFIDMTDPFQIRYLYADLPEQASADNRQKHQCRHHFQFPWNR